MLRTSAYKLSDHLTVTISSITGYNHAWGVSEEDYNRIVPVDAFTPVNNAYGSLFGPALGSLPWEYFQMA